MKKPIPLLPLFKQFIKESESGKRLKNNGSNSISKINNQIKENCDDNEKEKCDDKN